MNLTVVVQVFSYYEEIIVGWLINFKCRKFRLIDKSKKKRKKRTSRMVLALSTVVSIASMFAAITGHFKQMNIFVDTDGDKEMGTFYSDV